MAKCLPPATGASGDSLLEDLINDILLRLPVKIILRCKAVSKSWRNLISSPHFVESHLRRAIAIARSGGDDETLIVNSYSLYDVSERSIVLLNVNIGKIEADLKLPYFKDEFPFVRKTCLVGSACGIVCICVCGSFHFSEFSNSIKDSPIDYIYLWNPATRQSIRIPQHTIDVKSTRWLIGFGFDHVSNDFKVVRIVVTHLSVEAEVYSTNRNCWKKVEQVHNYLFDVYRYNCNFVCVKGYLCCTRLTVILDKNIITSRMIAFDLDKEVLNWAIELPVTSYNTCITEFNDSIAVVNWDDMDGKYYIKLWKLEDETCLRVGGVEASWILMLNINFHMVVERVYSYLNNGGFLLSLGQDTCYLFNFDANVRKYIPRHIYPAQYFKYTESLVTLTGSELVDWSAGEGKIEVKDEGIDTAEQETRGVRIRFKNFKTS